MRDPPLPGPVRPRPRPPLDHSTDQVRAASSRLSPAAAAVEGHQWQADRVVAHNEIALGVGRLRELKFAAARDCEPAKAHKQKYAETVRNCCWLASRDPTPDWGPQCYRRVARRCAGPVKARRRPSSSRVSASTTKSARARAGETPAFVRGGAANRRGAGLGDGPRRRVCSRWPPVMPFGDRHL